MTVIITLLCKDGIVLASDTQSTISSIALKRRNNSKIHTINEKTVIAAAGDVAFIHRLDEKVDETLRKGDITAGMNARELRDFFCSQVHGIRCEYLEQFNKLGSVDSAPYAMFILCSHDGDHQAYSITPEGVYQKITDYEAIGSSKNYAEVILMNQYESDLNTEDGKQLAYWTIRQCCELDPFVSPPIRIIVLRNNKTDWVSDGELKAMESSYVIKKALFKALNKKGDDLLKILAATNARIDQFTGSTEAVQPSITDAE